MTSQEKDEYGNMRNHTPGPFVAIKGVDDEEDRWGVYATRPDGQYHVATIENGAPGDTLDTEESNARLFASAPKLLEDLTELEQLFALQRTRTLYADRLWQKEHKKPGVYPDLGELIQWLLMKAGLDARNPRNP